MNRFSGSPGIPHYALRPARKAEAATWGSASGGPQADNMHIINAKNTME